MADGKQPAGSAPPVHLIVTDPIDFIVQSALELMTSLPLLYHHCYPSHSQLLPGWLQ